MATATIHVFEKAGLGTAPFRVAGFEVKKYQACHGAPIQPGTSCDFCGTAIMNVYWIEGSDKRRFKVGCECVKKTGDRGIIRQVERMERARKTADAKLAKERRLRRLYTLLTMDAVIDAMAEEAHPMEWRADAGDTRVDWATWMLRNSGTAGKVKVARYVEGVAKVAGIAHRKVNEGDLDKALAHLDPAEPAPEVTPEPVPAPKPEERHVPAPEGKQTFRGEVVSKKAHEDHYGTSIKMTVKVTTDEGVYLVWGTCPAALLNDSRNLGAERGDTVEITATLKRSDRDEHFAFMKRPRGKVVTKALETEAV